jgi:hypothetical protein
MKSAIDIVIENRAIRDAEQPTEKEVIKKKLQPLCDRLEGAEMISRRFGTPTAEAREIMGITEEEMG